jgi:polyisoprenoid-binding protein YceI
MDSTRHMQPSIISTKLSKPALLIVLIGLLVLMGGVAYIWFSGGSGQPSSEIAAPALALQPGDTRTIFHITSDKSEVRFTVDETLLGNPNPVIGKTRQIAGDLLVDFQNPANTQLGPIRINVRTLETDNEIRNRALRGQILQSENNAYEFAEFIPTALVNLPNQVTIAEPLAFQIAGKLTLHGVTRDVTFDASVTPLSKTSLEGTASAVVLYKDFNMSIPEAPGVANISDDVHLEIDFTALAKNP